VKRGPSRKRIVRGRQKAPNFLQADLSGAICMTQSGLLRVADDRGAKVRGSNIMTVPMS
jgi:hypothetical protein